MYQTQTDLQTKTKFPKISLGNPKTKIIAGAIALTTLIAVSTGGFFLYKNRAKCAGIFAPHKKVAITQNTAPAKQVKAAETAKPAETPQADAAPADTTKTDSSSSQATNNIASTPSTSTTTSNNVAAATAAKPVTTYTTPAPKPAPAPAPTPAPAFSPENYVDTEIFNLVNAERVRVGAAQLAYNPLLGQAADIRVAEEAFHRLLAPIIPVLTAPPLTPLTIRLVTPATRLGAKTWFGAIKELFRSPKPILIPLPTKCSHFGKTAPITTPT